MGEVINEPDKTIKNPSKTRELNQPPKTRRVYESRPPEFRPGEEPTGNEPTGIILSKKEELEHIISKRPKNPYIPTNSSLSPKFEEFNNVPAKIDNDKDLYPRSNAPRFRPGEEPMFTGPSGEPLPSLKAVIDAKKALYPPKQEPKK